MKKLVLILASVFSGCSIRVIDMPVSSSAVAYQVIKPVERNESNLIRAGNELLVNRSKDLCRDVLAFDGHHDLSQLIVRGSDGLPALDFYSIGRFFVAPASGEYGDRLVGSFREGQQYTLLIISRSIKDGCKRNVCAPQIYYGRYETRPFGEKYVHQVGDKTVEETVNDIVYLPDADVSNQDFSNVPADLDFDSMLQRGVHRGMPRR